MSTGGLGYLFTTTDRGTAGAAAPAAPAGIISSSAAPTPPNPSTATPSTAAPSSSSTAAPTTTEQVTTPVVVNGETVTNRWGPVQVQVAFAADGTITSVDAVQAPFADGKSVRINDRAVPRLNSEALTAQSANVDTVSGATYTSVGYRQSLQSAIDIATANGVPVSPTATA